MQKRIRVGVGFNPRIGDPFFDETSFRVVPSFPCVPRFGLHAPNIEPTFAAANHGIP
jgi:hypothetical protein